MEKFGLNVQHVTPDYVPFLHAVRPRVVLGFGTHVGQGVASIQQAREILGDEATYIYRAWQVFDHGDLDNFERWVSRHGRDPRVFLNAMEPIVQLLGRDVYLHTFNETGISLERMAGMGKTVWEEYIDWHVAAVQEAQKRGWRLCMLNLATGTHDALHWSKARNLFSAICGDEDNFLIGVHEYFPGVWRISSPYHVGRYRQIVDAAFAFNGCQPKIVITETGTDYLTDEGTRTFIDSITTVPRDERGGWRSYAKGGFWHRFKNKPDQEKALAEELISLHRNLYDIDPQVVGSCYFCWGSHSPWETYDISGAATLREQLAAARKPNSSGGIPVTNPCDLIDTNAISVGPGGTYKVRDDIRLNIRAEPVVDTCSWTGLQFEAGAVVELTAVTDDVPGDFVWGAFYRDGETYWVALRTKGGDMVYMDPYTPPVADSMTLRIENPTLFALGQALATLDGVVLEHAPSTI